MRPAHTVCQLGPDHADGNHSVSDSIAEFIGVQYGRNVISKVILRGAVRRVILRKVAGRRIHAACGFRVFASLRAE